MLENKKVIVFGDGQEIKAESLKKCMEAAGAQVMLVREACFVWTAALSLDSASQEAIKKTVEENNSGDLLVVWGITNEQYLEIGSRTVIDGDPSWAGPLAGESLKLKVFHVLEPEIKKHIPHDVFDDELMLLELAVGDEKIEKITEMMEKFRSNLN